MLKTSTFFSETSPLCRPVLRIATTGRLQPGRRRRACFASGDKDTASQVEDRVSTGKATGKGFGAPPPTPKPSKKKEDKERPFKIDLPKPEEATPEDKFEAGVVRVLALLFVVFLAEGLLLAIAGFLPEEADAFITDYIYPSFSPTLGVFLAISVVYGLVKSRQNTA